MSSTRTVPRGDSLTCNAGRFYLENTQCHYQRPLFSSLHRQGLSWSHACGRSGAQKGFDLTWPAVSAGTHGSHKLTTYQNMCLQRSREFSSHLSLDCWFADGGCCWGSVGLGEDLLQDKCWNIKEKGDEVFSALLVNGAADSQILQQIKWSISLLAEPKQREFTCLEWLCLHPPCYCTMHLSDIFSID